LNALTPSSRPQFRDVTRGVMNKDSALEALLAVRSAFAGDPAFLRETRSDQALQVIGLLFSAEVRRGKPPVAPGPWGKFLEYIRNSVP